MATFGARGWQEVAQLPFCRWGGGEKVALPRETKTLAVSRHDSQRSVRCSHCQPDVARKRLGSAATNKQQSSYSPPLEEKSCTHSQGYNHMTHQRYFASNPQTSVTILESQERSSKRRRPLKPFVQLIKWRNFRRKFIRFPSHEVVIQWTAPPNATVHITYVSQRRRRLGDPNNKIPKYRVQETIDSIWFQLTDC